MLISDLRFLVAEDHEFQRSALVRLLTALGATRVYEAADGHAALEIIGDAGTRVDIVISDVDMPGMDGMEFIRRLCQTDSSIAMILASALASPLIASVAAMAEAYGIRLLGVVEKPLTRRKLAPLIKLYQPVPHTLELPPEPTFTLDEIAAGLRNGEFDAFFQPKIDLVTGQVKGAEALARWRHAPQGIIAPHAFVKSLEDNGLIDELTWLMLTKAAAFCNTWQERAVDVTVSVNLSIKSLDDMDMAERVTDLVRRQNVEPRRVVLELTESAATLDVGKVLENLARLRIKGFGLSIDDYGTGYSSMQQLARIAFTELKIDQSFVMNAGKHHSARAMLESSVEVAKKLNITSVAEGVETRASFDLLCQLRCDMAQGYFIARPMEPSAYPAWFRRWQNRRTLLTATI